MTVFPGIFFGSEHRPGRARGTGGTYTAVRSATSLLARTALATRPCTCTFSTLVVFLDRECPGRLATAYQSLIMNETWKGALAGRIGREKNLVRLLRRQKLGVCGPKLFL